MKFRSVRVSLLPNDDVHVFVSIFTGQDIIQKHEYYIYCDDKNKPTKYHAYNETIAKSILTYIHKEPKLQPRFYFDARFLISTLYNMFKRLR